jgi:hypothetical protein
MVQWGYVCFTAAQVADRLSPMAKLVVVANPTSLAKEYGSYTLNVELHPECAAEWGMHLIQDALIADPSVGRKLRSYICLT